MLDRQKVESILTRRFPGASIREIAAAANGIMGLGDEWEEIAGAVDGSAKLHSSCSYSCLAGCEPGDGDVRVFRRRVV